MPDKTEWIESLDSYHVDAVARVYVDKLMLLATGMTIHKLRRMQGITQEDFAKHASIGLQHAQDIEESKRLPSMSILQSIIKILDYDEPGFENCLKLTYQDLFVHNLQTIMEGNAPPSYTLHLSEVA